jgi:hypothetical protein
VPDFADIRDAVRRGDHATLQRFLDEGWDVNERERWTGTNALCLAAHAGNAEMVELLLRHGADPNSCDNDGYFAYGVLTSRRIRELLLAHGFSWGQWQPTGYPPDTVAQLRVLAPREPAADRWTETVTNTDLFVEHIVLELPVPAGTATVSVTLDGRESYTATLARPGHERRRLTAADAAAARATVTVHCDRFVGEIYARLFSSAAVDRLEGARTFWLPDYTMYQVART